MKILHTVESYFPSVEGMPEAVGQISEGLAKLGHEVTVITSFSSERKAAKIRGVSIKEFRVSGNYAMGMSGEIDMYRKFVRENCFDIIANFAAQQWATDAVLDILPLVKGKKVFVPTGFSGLYRPEFKDYFIKMSKWILNYDHCVFLSHDYRDINFAKKCEVKNYSIIPNGASLAEFYKPAGKEIRCQLGIPEDCFLILLVGSHTKLKGHREAREIFKKANISKAALLIVGNPVPGGCGEECVEESDGRILVKTLSRKETVMAFKNADLFLFPSNLECSPIVLFEAMAAKLPFLATPAGNTAEIIKWSGGGRLLPSVETEIKGYPGGVRAKIDESAKVLNQMYNNKSLRHRLGDSGYRAWKQNFTWEKISQQYEKLYQNLRRQYEN